MNHMMTKVGGDDVTLVDRRASPRRKTRFKATVIHGPGRAAVDCVVRDLSEAGARLRVEAPGGLPTTFHLIWLAEKAVLEVESVWRSQDEIGVKFLSKHHMQGRLSSELAAVCRAWEQRGRAAT